MPELVLIPNTAGDLTELAPVGGTNLQCAQVHNDGKYVIGTGRDLYNLDDSALASLITKVTIRAHTYCPSVIYYYWLTDYAGNYQRYEGWIVGRSAVAIKTNGALYESALSYCPPDSEVIRELVYYLNPYTGAAWTWSEINALQAGFKLATESHDSENPWLEHNTVTAYPQGDYVEVRVEHFSTPSLTTQAATAILYQSATLNGTIASIGQSAVDERGFVYDTVSHGDPGDTDPAASNYDNNWTEAGSFSAGAFSKNVTGLTSSQIYYARSCAHNAQGWDYGEQVCFETQPFGTEVTVDVAHRVCRIRITGCYSSAPVFPTTYAEYMALPRTTAYVDLNIDDTWRPAQIIYDISSVLDIWLEIFNGLGGVDEYGRGWWPQNPIIFFEDNGSDEGALRGVTTVAEETRLSIDGDYLNCSHACWIDGTTFRSDSPVYFGNIYSGRVARMALQYYQSPHFWFTPSFIDIHDLKPSAVFPTYEGTNIKFISGAWTWYHLLEATGKIAVRFLDVAVPQGARITSATLGISGYYGDPQDFNIRVEDVDSAGLIRANLVNDILVRNYTSRVSANNYTMPLSGGYYWSPDFSESLQKVINRPGWESGNDLVILLEDDPYISLLGNYQLKIMYTMGHPVSHGMIIN